MTSLAALIAVAGVAAAHTITTSEPAMVAIQAAEATTLPQKWTSDAKGVAFDRFYQV